MSAPSPEERIIGQILSNHSQRLKRTEDTLERLMFWNILGWIGCVLYFLVRVVL